MSTYPVAEVLMPAPIHPLVHHETLANGLRLALRHAPGLKRCAAVLRVAAGSHDAPLAWPGLAHFLEHLLFLGTERFPASDGLMAYVQRQGGQLNAQTGERRTDFFFELPPEAFAAGLERLGDMLAHPRLHPDEQLREREVLQAEYLAWSQDAAAQQHQALFDGLAADHPLRGFHAGNRDSLAVQHPEFQQALKDYYQRFYQTGQMTLSLVGPQPVDQLQRLAQLLINPLRVGVRQPQSPPHPLMSEAVSSYQQASEQQLNLLFACEGLPESSAEALDYLCTWLNCAKPGGLLAELRQRQWVDSLKATALYHFAGQALLHVQFQLSATATAQPASIRSLFNDWLSFFGQQYTAPKLGEEYALLQQRRRQSSNALSLARLDIEPVQPLLPESAVGALATILQQLDPAPVDNPAITWQLPPPNPFLRSAEEPPAAGLIRGQTSAHRGLRTFAQDRTRGRRERSALQFNLALPDTSGEGAVCLRWRLASTPSANLQPVLARSLQGLIDDAGQAGVELSFSETGDQWLLKLLGRHEPMPAILEQALLCLTQPAAEHWHATQAPPGLIAIRQLLKALPEVCLGQTPGATADAAGPADLPAIWASAHWDGLAAGLPASAHTTITRALSRAPGIADSEPMPPVAIAGQRLWSTVPCQGGEHALLLFCPTPSRDVADEAAWRLLAQLSQTPYYQRLRVELQLGYAVFSGVRQIHGQTGLLFGVQSPGTPAAQLLAHIEAFIQQLPTQLASLDDAALAEQLQTLAGQLDSHTLPLPQAFELLWQGKLANHPSDYLMQLQQAVLNLQRPALLHAAHCLEQATGGWRCVSSDAGPQGAWQTSGGSLPGL